MLWEEEEYFNFKTMKGNTGLSWSPWRTPTMTTVSRTAMQRQPHHCLMICQALGHLPRAFYFKETTDLVRKVTLPWP